MPEKRLQCLKQTPKIRSERAMLGERQVWTSVNGGFGSSINYVNSNSGLSQRCWRHRRHNRSRQYTGLSITETRPVFWNIIFPNYYSLLMPSMQCSLECNWGGIIMNSHILPHRSSTIQKVYLLEKQTRGKNFLWQVFRHSWEGVEGPAGSWAMGWVLQNRVGAWIQN